MRTPPRDDGRVMSLARARCSGRNDCRALGAGGMGEVYRARDTRLKRDVAIKVLPAAFAADPERLARFEREAQVLASLNHPNIARDLRFRGIERRHAPWSWSWSRARRWRTASRRGRCRSTSAADRAADRRGARGRARAGHRPSRSQAGEHQGAPDGTVKVLDFGLAKALDPASGSGLGDRRDEFPTLTARATQARHDPRHGGVHGARAGARQGRGPARRHLGVRRRAVRDADRAGGCSRARRISDTLAAVLTQRGRLDAAAGGDAADDPAAAARAVSSATSTQRLRDIGEARLTLSATGAAEPASPPVATSRRPASFARLLAAGLAGVVVGAAAWGLRPRPVVPAPLTAISITPPPAGRLHW